MYLPQKYIQKAVNDKIKSLGYSISGVTTFPRVEVYDFITTPTGEKENIEWICTFLIDVISTDASTGLTILETIRNNFNLTISHFENPLTVFEQHTEIDEEQDGLPIINRQLQRIRLHIKETN